MNIQNKVFDKSQIEKAAAKVKKIPPSQHRNACL